MTATAGKARYVIERTVPTLIWGREDGEFHTRVSLFNYYSLLFEDRPVTSRAYVYLFQEDGSEVGRFDQVLPLHGQWQFDLSTVIRDFQGSVGVQLVPDYLPPLSHARYLGALFFATYWDARGHCDFTHETDRMRFEDDRRFQYEPATIPTSPQVEMSIIVQNSFFGANPAECDPRLTITVKNATGKTLLDRTLELGLRASRLIPLAELLTDYRQRLGGQVGSVHVKGRHINQPLTFLRHASGDFNVHHF
jgi:hypothetical protein